MGSKFTAVSNGTNTWQESGSRSPKSESNPKPEGVPFSNTDICDVSPQELAFLVRALRARVSNSSCIDSATHAHSRMNFHSFCTAR